MELRQPSFKQLSGCTGGASIKFPSPDIGRFLQPLLTWVLRCAALRCAVLFVSDATVELPSDLARKKHKPKPHIPSEYQLERPIHKPESPDQDNPIVFYDVW